MKLLDDAFYMYWRQFAMLPLGLASKLGFQPLTKAVLVAISKDYDGSSKGMEPGASLASSTILECSFVHRSWMTIHSTRQFILPRQSFIIPSRNMAWAMMIGQGQLPATRRETLVSYHWLIQRYTFFLTRITAYAPLQLISLSWLMSIYYLPALQQMMMPDT
jgi:hypothetical protein